MFYFKSKEYDPSLQLFVCLPKELILLCADYAFLLKCERDKESFKSNGLFILPSLKLLEFDSSICVQTDYRYHQYYDGQTWLQKNNLLSFDECWYINLLYVNDEMILNKTMQKNEYFLQDLHSNQNDIFRILRRNYSNKPRILLRQIAKDYVKYRHKRSTSILLSDDIWFRTYSFSDFEDVKHNLQQIKNLMEF